MTGAEHYAKAEECLRLASVEVDVDITKELQQAAQAHATLALVQATLVGMEMADWDKP